VLYTRYRLVFEAALHTRETMMRRFMAWLAGGLVLAGGTFGTFAIVETGMASAAPSFACSQAQARVQQAKFALFITQDFGAILSFEGPAARAKVGALIAQAEGQLAAAQQAANTACVIATSTMTSTTTTSMTATSITRSSITATP
jgi:hypothetical protein